MTTAEKIERDERFRESIKFGKEILKCMATSREVIQMYGNKGMLGDVALRMAMGFDLAVYNEIEEQGKDWDLVTDLIGPKEIKRNDE